ncbi:MAG: biotin--[acetyl-CoA-carboxylase] ligase [Christensenellales bacterium]
MTKDRVVAILRNAHEYLSGEEISRTLGLSRAAVNAAVQSLRRDGYEISSATNRGYLLVSAPDHISAGELLAHLPPARLARIECLDTVDSTNNYLKMRAQEGAPDGLIAIADAQTRGKGRLGRSFLSPGGRGIYLSMLLRPEGSAAPVAHITAMVAVAVSDAIEAVAGVRPGIKWVNDLLIGGKKICGILTEMSVEGESGCISYIVTGIGVNVHGAQADFPPELRESATSIAAETGVKVRRAALAAEMIRRLDELWDAWPGDPRAYVAPYRRDCVTIGREVRYERDGAEVRGFAEDIDDAFGLIVRLPSGERETLNSGEVSVRGIYGYA